LQKAQTRLRGDDEMRQRIENAEHDGDPPDPGDRG
jgi:hypothetical protein